MNKRKRSSNGQALILIIIIILGIIVGSALLSGRVERARRTPTVQAAFWTTDGERVTAANVGSEVTAHVTIKATEEYVGSIVAKIRKDVSLWFDSDYQVSTVPVNLVGGQEREVSLTFVPDQPSGGSLRGYFIELGFAATGTNWLMENTYPPRLRVTA